MSDTPRIVAVCDLSHLPRSATGADHLVWWGNVGFMLIEGTGFALAAAAYLYFMTQAPVWPPEGDAVPDLLWGGVFTAGLLASELPNLLVLRWARAKHRAGVRWGMLAMSLITLALLGARAMEFHSLGLSWYNDSFGSITWLLLVLHTTHIVTEWGESAVLTAWLFTHEVEDDQFADVEDNSNYWTFVAICWLPLYVLIYWTPRLS